MIKNYTNEELLVLMKRGDRSAFGEIYSRFFSRMFLYAVKILKNKEVCEDIIQNIFIDLWFKRKNTKIASLSPYLLRAVKYQVFNHLRNNRFSNEDLTRLNIIDVSMNISKQMEYDELEKRIYAFVKELPCKCQHIFELSRFEHKSNKEISEELGISIQAVKNQISKALKVIRRNLQQEELVFFNFLLFQ